MKILSKINAAIILITLFASCQINKDANKILSKSETRKEIMLTIANSVNMSKEMKDVMLDKENAHWANHDLVEKVVVAYPGMVQKMKPNLIEKYKSDNSIPTTIQLTMMVN